MDYAIIIASAPLSNKLGGERGLQPISNICGDMCCLDHHSNLLLSPEVFYNAKKFINGPVSKGSVDYWSKCKLIGVHVVAQKTSVQFALFWRTSMPITVSSSFVDRPLLLKFPISKTFKFSALHMGAGVLMYLFVGHFLNSGGWPHFTADT